MRGNNCILLRDSVERRIGLEHFHSEVDQGGIDVIFFLLRGMVREAEMLAVDICTCAMESAGCRDWVVPRCMATPVGQAENLIVSKRPRASGPRLLRQLNEQYILGLIRTMGQVSRAELARVSGLSKPTVSSAVSHLESSGLVEASGRRNGRPGRAATLYRVGQNAGWALGADVRDDTVRWGISRLDGTDRVTLTTAHGRGDPAADVDTLCERAGIIRHELLWAVAGFSPASRGSAVDATLARLFGTSYSARRGDEMEMLSRYRRGGGSPARVMAYVTIGHSIEIGLVIDGEPRPPAAPRTSDLERLVGSGPVSPGELAGRAERGEQDAVRVISELAALTARLLQAVWAIVPPDLVVLVGRPADAPGFADLVRSELPGAAEVEVEDRADPAETFLDGCLDEACDLAWKSISDSLGPN